MSLLRKIGVGCMAVAAVFVTVSAYAAWCRSALFSHPVKTRGSVARVEGAETYQWTGSRYTGGPIPHRDVVYDLIVHYRDQADEVRETRLNGVSNAQVGDAIELIYEAGNPANVIPADTGWSDVLGNLGLSLLPMAFGVLFYVSPRWLVRPGVGVDETPDDERAAHP